MHKKTPKIFIFIDQYNSKIFNNKKLNIGIVYRNYKDKNRENQLIKIARACNKYKYQLYVSNDIKLAYKYKADGIYIPSFNKTKKFLNLEKKSMKILGSAHTQKEIHKKITQNCKTIFLSPLFRIKKSKSFLDIHRFNYLARLNKINILALGGISKNNIRKLKLVSINGFGGINFFKKKTGLKEAGFHKE